MVQTGITAEWLLEGFRYELEARTRPATVHYYCGEVRRFLEWAGTAGIPKDASLVTRHHIQAFFHHLVNNNNCSIDEAGRTERLRWPYYRALCRFFAWAVREGYLEHNPMDGVVFRAPQDPQIEPYRPEHIHHMLKVLDHDWQIARTPRQRMLAARDRAVLLLFLESGLRLMELTGLKVADLYIERQRIFVREGKTGKGRLAGFGAQTKKALWRYFGLRPGEVQSDALWLTEEGRPLTKHGVQEIIRRLKKDAGLEHIKGSVHKLRHTFATTYLRHTKDMKGCRLLLGHSTLAMTERYTQFIEVEDALKAYDGKGPLDWMRDE